MIKNIRSGRPYSAWEGQNRSKKHDGRCKTFLNKDFASYVDDEKTLSSCSFSVRNNPICGTGV